MNNLHKDNLYFFYVSEYVQVLPNPLNKGTCSTGLETGCKPFLFHSFSLFYFLCIHLLLFPLSFIISFFPNYIQFRINLNFATKITDKFCHFLFTGFHLLQIRSSEHEPLQERNQCSPGSLHATFLPGNTLWWGSKYRTCPVFKW